MVSHAKEVHKARARQERADAMRERAGCNARASQVQSEDCRASWHGTAALGRVPVRRRGRVRGLRTLPEKDHEERVDHFLEDEKERVNDAAKRCTERSGQSGGQAT